MIGYNTLQKSMNGIKVLTDGISFISNGDAQHNNIIYNEYIKSNDGKTTIDNNSLDTENIDCIDLSCSNLTTDTINSKDIKTNYLLVFDFDNSNNIALFDGKTNKKITFWYETELNNKLTLINNDFHQTQTGIIYQQGTGQNYFKDSYINGSLTVGSNFVQTGGSSSIKALSCDTITQNTDKGITQNGNNVNNLGGTTTMKNLIITDSIIFPSNVLIPATTTNNDLIMQNDAVITQDITVNTTKFNQFRNTRTLDLTINGNITQTLGNGTAIIKNTTIQGTCEIQGDITQTAGTTILKTIRCNNITLNDDQIITQSGTGFITQSGTGQNVMKEINLLSNSNLIFNGSGIINQPLNGINILSHCRCTGFSIVSGKNNTTYSNYQNVQNNDGFQIQFNRDNSTKYSFLINNRGSGGNGGFRFQRYSGGVYLDEPMIIDDNITMNKNLLIPGGSITCSSAYIGNISNDELNCLDNCNVNIIIKFNTIDSQITSINSELNSLNSASNSYSTALTGITYVPSNDTTTIDNNLSVTKNFYSNGYTSLYNGNLVINANSSFSYKNMNMMNTVLIFNEALSGNGITSIYRNTSKDLYFDSYYYNNGAGGGFVFRCKNPNGTDNFNDVLNIQSTGLTATQPVNINSSLFVNSVNIGTNITNINNAITGISYNSTDDITTIDNTLTVNNNLIVKGMNVYDEIESLDTSFTTGTINTTDLTTNNLICQNDAQLNNDVYVGNDLFVNDGIYSQCPIFLCDVGTKNTLQSTKIYQQSNNLYFENKQNSKYIFKNITGTQSYNTLLELGNEGSIINAFRTNKYYDSLLLNDNNYKLKLICGSGSGAWNPNVSENDIVIAASYVKNNTVLNLVSHSDDKNGIRIKNTNTTINGGNNNIIVDKTDGIICDSSNLNIFVHSSPTYLYTKTIGTTNVLTSTITIQPNFNKAIIGNVPISVYRYGTNNSGGNVTYHYETLSNITAYYTKDDVFINNIAITPNEVLPLTKEYRHTSPSFGYEQYFCNAIYTFLPTYDKLNTHIYKIYFTFTYSYSSSFSDNAGTISGYYVNTDCVNKQNIHPSTLYCATPSGQNYSSSSFSTDISNVNYMTSNNSQLQTNDIVCNNIFNQSTIKTLSITTNDLKLNNSITLDYNINIVKRELICGVLLDGPTTGSNDVYNVICSLKYLNSNNNIDALIIQPGYKFQLYFNDNYSGTMDVYDNTNGLTPMYYVCANANVYSSIRVYYKNVEITYTNLS